jgi:light-harvesting complex I chlorophyll a/b binding protein 1
VWNLSQAGDQGWDPLGISTLIDVRWLREAELKHGRVCMLAATGLLVQDVYQFPGTVATFGDAKVTALHNAAVSQGAMQQLLVWIGFFELFGFVAIVQMLQGSDRQPGDFGFDPLDLAKDDSKFARRQLVELKNGRLAMLGFSGMLVGESPRLPSPSLQCCMGTFLNRMLFTITCTKGE